MLILLRHPFDVGVKFIAQPVEKIAQLLLRHPEHYIRYTTKILVVACQVLNLFSHHKANQ